MRTIRAASRQANSFRCIPATNLILVIFLLFIAAACDFDGALNVSAEKLRTMIASGKPVLVVDTRTEGEYRDGHIPGSILIPELKAPIADRFLPPDKDLTIVFYCRGAG